jgi:hypothetical protein
MTPTEMPGDETRSSPSRDVFGGSPQCICRRARSVHRGEGRGGRRAAAGGRPVAFVCVGSGVSRRITATHPRPTLARTTQVRKPEGARTPFQEVRPRRLRGGAAVSRRPFNVLHLRLVRPEEHARLHNAARRTRSRDTKQGKNCKNAGAKTNGAARLTPPAPGIKEVSLDARII